MKVLLGILLGLACGVGLWMLVETRGGTANKTSSTALAPAHDDAHLSELERRVASLESEMQRIAFELAQQSTTRSSGTQTFVPTPADVKRSGEGIDPRWYLQEYARSFETSSEGSEYFRLAVDAYAPLLLNEICDIVRESSARAELRSRLARMLGTPRFARNGLALDALFAMLRNSDGDALAFGALEALVAIGDGQTGVALERLIWTFTSLDVQKKTLATIVQLDGPDANRALQRLLASATTTEQRELVLGALSTADPDAALEVLRLASSLEDPVRLKAAFALQKFRGEAFVAFVDEWLGFERDERVRQVLSASRAKLTQTQPYAAMKATGAPDAVATQDHPNAWASQNPDMGMQWLELGYKPARRANAVRIHEVYVPGAVAQVSLYDEGGNRHEVWSGMDPTSEPGVFEVSFATTSYRVKAVRIVLDTNRKPGWSEIDAVELVGPDGNAWAVDASASSSYGQ